MVVNNIILSYYFGNSFKTRDASYHDLLTFKANLRTRGVLFQAISFLLGRSFFLAKIFLYLINIWLFSWYISIYWYIIAILFELLWSSSYNEISKLIDKYYSPRSKMVCVCPGFLSFILSLLFSYDMIMNFSYDIFIWHDILKFQFHRSLLVYTC